MSKKLVAYFSAGGVTAKLAETLAETAGADLYEIKPEIPYTEADLDWKDKESRSSVEMKDLAFRPAIADKNANIADYDVIFVGFPIWWHISPTVVNTFLESYDFSGKTVAAFATSGSSPIGDTVEMLRPSAPAAVFTQGKLLKNRFVEEDLAAWLKELGL